MSSLPEPPKEAIRFRRLDKPEEFRQLGEVQRAAFGLEAEGTIPPPLQRALQDNGGLVLGAFVDIALVGFALGFLGWDGRQHYNYSHMTAVRPEYHNHRVGFRHKSYQRDEVLAQGLTEVRWTFDPLRSRNALLNIRRLGALPTSYYPHYYGRMDDALNRDLETDRLSVRWEIGDDRVAQRLAGVAPSPEEDLARWDASTPIIETEVGESGLRLPSVVAEPGAPRPTSRSRSTWTWYASTNRSRCGGGVMPFGMLSAQPTTWAMPSTTSSSSPPNMSAAASTCCDPERPRSPSRPGHKPPTGSLRWERRISSSPLGKA